MCHAIVGEEYSTRGKSDVFAFVPLDSTQALQRIYAGARYDLRIDCSQQPARPLLSSEDAA